LHFLPTRLIKSDMAPSVRSVEPSLAFPTKLTDSRYWKCVKISVRDNKVLLFIVKADAFPIVALDPWRSPNAPSDSVFKWESSDMMASISVFDTRVDVSDNFCNDNKLFGWKNGRGCKTSVKDRSRRCKLGQRGIKRRKEESDREVWRSFRVRRFLSLKSSCWATPARNLAKVASV